MAGNKENFNMDVSGDEDDSIDLLPALPALEAGTTIDDYKKVNTRLAM